MIVFFGPPGAGKSVQGQLLAARQGWRWLSTGQLLRDTKDPEIAKILLSGKLRFKPSYPRWLSSNARTSKMAY
jgi:adenylate kinase